MRFRWEGTECAEDVRRWGDEVFRYDEGTRTMVPDDGGPAMAFSFGSSALYIGIPHSDNLLGTWRTAVGEGEGDFRHGCKQSWLWCHATRDGQARDGECYPDRNGHPNEVAGRAAMDFACARNGCASGRSMDHPNYLKSAEGHECAWCARDGLGHRLDDINARIDDMLGRIDYDEKEIAGAERTIMYCTESLESERAELARLRAELAVLDRLAGEECPGRREGGRV